MIMGTQHAYDPARREASRKACRRPIDEWEVAHLERLAAGLRTARNVAGLSQDALAWRANLNPSTIYRIEAGVRRTRLSTLRRIAEALVGAAPWMVDADRLAADLATLAGLGLAPESQYRERIERRRARRERRWDDVSANYRRVWELEEESS
jgi:transcriptional regulator with XRE-family HTH domain